MNTEIKDLLINDLEKLRVSPQIELIDVSFIKTLSMYILYYHEYLTFEFQSKRLDKYRNGFVNVRIHYEFIDDTGKVLSVDEKEWYKLLSKISKNKDFTDYKVVKSNFRDQTLLLDKIIWLKQNSDIKYIGELVYYTELPEKFNDNISLKGKIGKWIICICNIFLMIMSAVVCFVNQTTVVYSSFVAVFIFFFANEIMIRTTARYYNGIKLLILNNHFIKERFVPYISVVKTFFVFQFILFLSAILVGLKFTDLLLVLIFFIPLSIVQLLRLLPVILFINMTIDR